MYIYIYIYIYVKSPYRFLLTLLACQLARPLSIARWPGMRQGPLHISRILIRASGTRDPEAPIKYVGCFHAS